MNNEQSQNAKFFADHNFVREFALTLLDTPSGIRQDAYDGFIYPMLQATGNEDIAENVDVNHGVAYIGEDFAEEELHKLSTEMASDVVADTIGEVEIGEED